VQNSVAHYKKYLIWHKSYGVRDYLKFMDIYFNTYSLKIAAKYKSNWQIAMQCLQRYKQ